jgi:hypothetical protein
MVDGLGTQQRVAEFNLDGAALPLRQPLLRKPDQFRDGSDPHGAQLFGCDCSVRQA